MEALRERFGKYHVLEKIAQGGMAEVYKVKTVGIAGFEKIQALKRILPHSAREGRFIRSFIDEARIAVELTHRNIVQVFDFGKADGELFLAMELIEGRDLRTALVQAGQTRCPIPVAAYVLGEVAAGLDYAHRKTDLYGAELNIVHCDVSPSNVMLSLDGYVKILDFGIARATFASALERRRLRGKPRYMAPEQTYGEPPTAAADVFALGIIGWELFTNMPLYHGPDLKAILDAVRRMDPPRIDRASPDTPREIVDAIARALRREPTERGTAADLVAACARTALQGGASALAGWLGALDASSPRAPGIVAPRSQPPTIQPSPADAPSRPSQTLSLANAPVPPVPATVGEGTPGFGDPGQFDGERTTTARRERFGDRDPTTRAPAFASEPTTTARAAWQHDGTAAGAARLADALPVREATQSIIMPVPDEPARPSYAALVPAAGVAPSALRFDDDDATQHAPAATGFEELVVEADPPPAQGDAPAAPVEDAIDDAVDGVWSETAGEVGRVVERRRAVIVAGVLDGAAPDGLRPIARALAELAYQRGGVAVALDAASLVVAFGLEIAGEDDVAIAMGWALDAAGLLKDDHWESLRGGASGARLRIGGRTGVPASTSATAGTRIPDDAIEEARSLAQAATPERPLFAGGAGRLTSDLFELREATVAHRLRRGRVLEVIGPRGFEERARTRWAQRGRFIGRAAQLAELERWFERARADDRRYAVTVDGAAGTGKSRLVAELIARATATDPNAAPRIISIAANPASRLSPFSMVIELYQAALGQPPARGRSARTQLTQRLHHRLRAAGVAEVLARAVATDLDRAMELTGGVGIGAPEVADLRPRISAGLATFRAALRDPLQLVVIEDIHLADGPSLEVLRHSFSEPAPGGELVVLTARPGGQAPPPVDAEIAIADLVGSELRALIADRLGDVATPANIAAVIARAGGNPLFVEELAQAVRDARGDAEIPPSARDVALARIERLSPRARTAVRFAAAMTGVVRARLVEELLGDEAEGTANALDELVAAGVLVPVAGGDGELVFARGLVREVVADAMPLRAQQTVHARIGRLLAARFFAGREEPPAVIASHLEQGGELAAAAAFWLRAGRLAMTASDADTAAQCFTRTLELEQKVGEPPPTAPSKTRRREAYAGRELANRLRGDLASNPDDIEALAVLCGREPARLADVAIRRAHRLLRTGDFNGAMVATVVAEDLAAQAPGNGRLAGEALRVRAELLERLGRFDEAEAVVERSRALFADAGALIEEMQAMVGRGRILLMRADYKAARAVYQPIVERLRHAGDPWLERVVQNHLAIVEMCLGNYAVAMQCAQRSLELCRRYGDRAREGDALSVSGIVQLEAGLYARAATTFDEALALLGRAGTRWSRADCLIYTGACAAKRGRFADALAFVDEALAEARAISARYLEANALVTRASVHLGSGAPEAIALALVDAAAAAAVARAAGLAGYELQALARQAAALVRSSSLADERSIASAGGAGVRSSSLADERSIASAGGAGVRSSSARRAEAAELIERALAMLEAQGHVEGSEEDLFMHCVAVLRATGNIERAAAVKARAAAEVKRKAALLSDPEWRTAYLARVECRALLS